MHFLFGKMMICMNLLMDHKKMCNFISKKRLKVAKFSHIGKIYGFFIFNPILDMLQS